MSYLRTHKGASAALTIAALVFTMSVAVPAFGGTTAFTAASVAKTVKKALSTAKSAKKIAVKAQATANAALAKAAVPGPAGPAGPKGETGATGATGAQGPAGPFPSGNVPSGVTIRGNFDIAERQSTTGEFKSTSASFGFQLASAPTTHFIPEAGTAPAQCPGTVTNPQAAPDNLCVYEGVGGNQASGTQGIVFNPSTGAAGEANRWGFGIYVIGGTSTAANVISYGTWAVTSP